MYQTILSVILVLSFAALSGYLYWTRKHREQQAFSNGCEAEKYRNLQRWIRMLSHCDQDMVHDLYVAVERAEQEERLERMVQ